jgi:hypothetical protein
MPDIATPSGILLLALTCVVALLMFAARTQPDQVKSNLSAWAETCGIGRVPPWLRSRAADRATLHMGRIALALFFVIGLLWLLRLSGNAAAIAAVGIGMMIAATGFAFSFLPRRPKSDFAGRLDLPSTAASTPPSRKPNTDLERLDAAL